MPIKRELFWRNCLMKEYVSLEIQKPHVTSFSPRTFRYFPSRKKRKEMGGRDLWFFFSFSNAALNDLLSRWLFYFLFERWQTFCLLGQKRVGGEKKMTHRHTKCRHATSEGWEKDTPFFQRTAKKLFKKKHLKAIVLSSRGGDSMSEETFL